MRRRKGEWAIVYVSLGGLFLCVFILMVAAWKAGYVARTEHVDVIIEPVPTPRQTLPQKCVEFLEEPHPASWNPDTDTYPVDDAWRNCMGVGYRRHMVRTDF